MARTSTSNETGQTLIEFALTSALAVSMLAAVGHLLWREKLRLECQHRLFESTLRRLSGGSMRLGVSQSIRFRDDGRVLVGSAECVGRTETVTLPHLEHAQW